MAKLTNEQLARIQEFAAEGYINIQHHPTLPLILYNYSKFALFYHKGDPIIELCRGLICDEEGNIIARPFTKFYNYEEIDDKSIIPNRPFTIWEKMDGSLGIMYWYDGKPHIATRGSFSSDQAIHAEKVLYERYGEYFHRFNPNYTYLFEIIYPEDIHIVNYDKMDDIVLLAIINTETEEEYTPESMCDIFLTPTCYEGITDYLQIRDLIPGSNKEGFVIKFDNNFRLKLKYAEYFELHSILYGLSEKNILEHIVNGTLQEIYDKLSKFEEEQKIYLNETVQKFQNIYNRILTEAKTLYRDDFETQKEAAAYFTQQKYQGILFTMYNGKDYSQAIWKYIWKNRTDYTSSVNTENDDE